MKKRLVLAILSLGAVFIALVFSASPDKPDRYFDKEKGDIVSSPTPDIEDVKEIPLPEAGTDDSIEEEDFFDVVRVVDGDTVKINRNGKEETLRLIGMNTPETVDPRTTVECFGKEASDKAKESLTSKRVKLEFDEGEGVLDKYQRTLAYIYTEDGVMFNEWMIKNGYAYEYTYDDAYKYQTEFKSAERYARDNELGLWNPKTCSGEL